jgi:hypothetical protein
MSRGSVLVLGEGLVGADVNGARHVAGGASVTSSIDRAQCVLSFPLPLSCPLTCTIHPSLSADWLMRLLSFLTASLAAVTVIDTGA